MEFKRNNLANVHARMAAIKGESHGAFSTNYFRQEMIGEQILMAGTDRTILFANDEYDFFRLYFFTSDLADLERMLPRVRYPADVVAGYLTRRVDNNVVTAFERAGFRSIATYSRMETYRLPQQQANSALEYAVAADADRLHNDLFRTFNRYTDHLPTKSRLLNFIRNQQVIIKRHIGKIMGAVCFQLHGLKVNYNYIYSLSGSGLDFLQLQNNFYGVMNQLGIRAGFLWINQANSRLAALYRATGWRFDGLQDHFYFRVAGPQSAPLPLLIDGCS
jgi:hypothetical protein